MLKALTVENFAVIDRIRAEFDNGFSVLTGETGAGKSILIDALEMALGKRARSNLVRADAEKLRVSIAIDTGDLPRVREWLRDHALDTEDDSCILRRACSKDGRSQAHINDSLVTLQQLKELGSLIVDIVGQNAHQKLLNKDYQLWLIDVRCDHLEQVEKMNRLYEQWRETGKRLETHADNLREREIRCEILKQQIEDLERNEISEGEYEKVEQEHRKLARGEELRTSLTQTDQILDGDEPSVTGSLNQVRAILEPLSEYDNQIKSAAQLILGALSQINDASRDIRACLESINTDEQDFKRLEERLRQICELARRYKAQPQLLFDVLQKAQSELAQLDNAETKREELEEERERIKAEYAKLATAISQKRRQVAKQIEQEVTNTLRQLNMAKAQLEIRLTPADKEQPAPNGYERAEFMMQTNPGYAAQSLALIASGGELSRISLALQMALSKYRTTPVLIFDEVDSGVGGATAEAVGKLLKTISQNAQVFCITHLPQVASYAGHHYSVDKSSDQNTTQVQIKMLDKTERRHEVARMMAGAEITRQSLSYAQEMLEKASLLAN